MKLCQVHMRHLNSPGERRLLDQRTVPSYKELDKWALEIREKYDAELPQGWIYELVTEGSKDFMEKQNA